MNPIVAFILGLLIGWLIEWVIDWLYWRKRIQACQQSLANCQENQKKYQDEIEGLKAENEDLMKKLEAAESKTVQAASIEPATPPVLDKLQKIKGIGPVIEGKLNEAGVYTFEQLAAKTPDDLRDMLGDVIERLADEDAIINQAKEFFQEKISKAR